MKVGQKWLKKDETRQLIILEYLGDDIWEVEIEILNEFYKGLMREVHPFQFPDDEDEEYIIIINESGENIYKEYNLID
jgi:hypothetical protein